MSTSLPMRIQATAAGALSHCCSVSNLWDLVNLGFPFLPKFFQYGFTLEDTFDRHLCRGSMGVKIQQTSITIRVTSTESPHINLPLWRSAEYPERHAVFPDHSRFDLTKVVT